MKKSLLLALCVALASPLLAGEPTTALLIIDIQDFYFPGGKVPLAGSSGVTTETSSPLAFPPFSFSAGLADRHQRS